MIVATCPECHGLVSAIWSIPGRYQCERCGERVHPVVTSGEIYWLSDAEMKQIEERMRIRQRILS